MVMSLLFQQQQVLTSYTTRCTKLSSSLGKIFYRTSKVLCSLLEDIARTHFCQRASKKVVISCWTPNLLIKYIWCKWRERNCGKYECAPGHCSSSYQLHFFRCLLAKICSCGVLQQIAQTLGVMQQICLIFIFTYKK